jgi:hypothetical protein
VAAVFEFPFMRSRSDLVPAHNESARDCACVFRELEGNPSSAVRAQGPENDVRYSMIEARIVGAGDAAHVDLVAIVIVVIVRGYLDYMTSPDAFAAAGGLADSAGVGIAMALVTPTAFARFSVGARIPAAEEFALAACLLASVWRFEEQRDTGDKKVPIARKIREQSARKRQGEFAFALAIATSRFKHPPCVGKFVAYVKQRPAVTDSALSCLVRSAAQQIAAFSCGVIQIQNNVAQRVHFEEVIFWRKLDPPPANRAEEFKW